MVLFVASCLIYFHRSEWREQCVVGSDYYGAGTNPYRSIVSFIFTMSGGPPALTMAAISLKKSGPINAGVTTASALASIVPGLLNPCTTPRRIKQDSPGP